MNNEDDGYGTFGDDEIDDEFDDEAPEKKKKRIATSTKVILVVAGWLLLTLFLVGQFSKGDAGPDTVSAQLDTVDEDFDDGGTPDIVDTEAEALFDADGDGYLDEAERAAVTEAYEAAVASGDIAVGEPWDGTVSEGSATATEEGATAAPAVPGAAPTAEGSTSGTPSGPASETTTTTAKAGGTSPTTTTTAKSGGTSSTTTTTAKASSTSTTNTTAASTAPTTVGVSASGLSYVYPSGYTKDIRVPRRSRITFKNAETSANIKHSFTISYDVWDSGEVDKKADLETSPELPAGSYTFKCTVHPTMQGTLTVT